MGLQSVVAFPHHARAYTDTLPLPPPTHSSTVLCVQVEWHKGSALEPETYAHLLPGVTAVVHTIGTLFEKSGYKSALKDGNVPRFVSSLAAGVRGSGPSANPLEREEKKREGSYEVVNRDTGAYVVFWFWLE